MIRPINGCWKRPNRLARLSINGPIAAKRAAETGGHRSAIDFWRVRRRIAQPGLATMRYWNLPNKSHCASIGMFVIGCRN
jgi:hypothetical protein